MGFLSLFCLTKFAIFCGLLVCDTKLTVVQNNSCHDILFMTAYLFSSVSCSVLAVLQTTADICP